MNINCEMARDLLPMFKDKCLSPSSDKALREHLKTCPACRRYLHEYRARQKDDILEPAGDFSEIARRMRNHRTVTELAVGLSIAALAAYAVLKTIKRETV
ncbi:MAG: zf-HC2 domain-containing protein [Clostridia bacterium]|nr:zf-HC2 domain-containing protein [Clostridia bacterium]